MNEINEVAPTSLSHLMGQKGVIDQVMVAIDAAFTDNRQLDSTMLVAPPVEGKSALAIRSLGSGQSLECCCGEHRAVAARIVIFGQPLFDPPLASRQFLSYRGADSKTLLVLGEWTSSYPLNAAAHREFSSFLCRQQKFPLRGRLAKAER